MTPELLINFEENGYFLIPHLLCGTVAVGITISPAFKTWLTLSLTEASSCDILLIETQMSLSKWYNMYALTYQSIETH